MVYDPSGYTGKLLWLRGKDLTGAAGSTLTTWPDMSGTSQVVTGTNMVVCDSTDVLPIAATASSTAGGGNAPSAAYDGSSGGGFLTAAVPTGWLRYQMASALVATSYGLTSINGQDSRMAKTWTFEGSPDGTAWTVLDTRPNETAWAGGTRFYDFANTTAYTYYRLNVTANNGDATYLGLSEMTVGINTTTKGARGNNGRLDGGINTGGSDRELWMVVNSRLMVNGLIACGNGGAACYYPYSDGKVYDDTFIFARQSFTPTMSILQVRRLVRITYTAAVWTFHIDNVLQLTVSAQVFNLGSLRRVINGFQGTVHEILLFDNVDNGSRKGELVTYFNTEHGLSATGGTPPPIVPTLTATVLATIPESVQLYGSGLAATPNVTVFRVAADGTRTPVRGLVDKAPSAGVIVGSDVEAPFGVPLTYVMIQGTTVTTSNTVTIRSATPVLSDPLRGINVAMPLVSWTSQDYDANRSVLKVIGRRNPVVVADVMTGFTTDDMTWWVQDQDTLKDLRTLLAPGSPILVRAPCDGIESAYVSVGASHENRWKTGGGADWRRTVQLTVNQVDAPNLTLEALGDTLGDIADFIAGPSAGTLGDIATYWGPSGTLLDIALTNTRA